MLKRLFLCMLLTVSTIGITKEFVIGVEDVSFYPLYDFKTDKDTFTRALFDEFGRQAGYTFTYLPLPIKRFNRWLLDEQIDFKYPDNVRWNPLGASYEPFVFSDSTIKLVAGTITSVDRDLTHKDIKVIGTLLGFHPTQWINQINAGSVKLYQSSSTLVLIQQLLHGQIDGLDIDQSVVQHHLKRLNQVGRLALNKNMSYEIYDYYFSTIKHKDVIIEFNQFLKNNQAFLQQLHHKFDIADYRPYEQ